MNSNLRVGEVSLVMMPERQALERLSAYVAENKQKTAFEAEVKYMDVKANVEEPAQEAM